MNEMMQKTPVRVVITIVLSVVLGGMILHIGIKRAEARHHEMMERGSHREAQYQRMLELERLKKQAANGEMPR